jgi:hypothetical protein
MDYGRNDKQIMVVFVIYEIIHPRTRPMVASGNIYINNRTASNTMNCIRISIMTLLYFTDRKKDL